MIRNDARLSLETKSAQLGEIIFEGTFLFHAAFTRYFKKQWFFIIIWLVPCIKRMALV